MSTPTLANAIAHALELIDQAAEACQSELAAQPDNPAIQRLSDRPSVFTVRSCKLFAHKTWDVFYHDWRAQYRLIGQLIRAHRFGALAEVLSSHSLRVRNAGLQRFAPEVVENAKRITGDLAYVREMVDATGLARAPGAAAKAG